MGCYQISVTGRNSADRSTSGYGFQACFYLCVVLILVVALLSYSCYNVHKQNWPALTVALSSTLWTYGGRTRRASSEWSQPMREVCATRKACPCHGGKKVSQHAGAVQGVRVQQPKDHSEEATRRLWGWVGLSQDTLPAFLPVCPTVSVSPSAWWGTFPTKDRGG